jgi:CheY-like chemotaxis protein
LRNVRVLVVEDSSEHLETLTISLQALGAQVYRATRPSEALSVYWVVHPDVIVCDLMLRGTTGTALLGQLRANGCTAPAIVLTSWDDDSRAAIAGAGFADHLVRPASPSMLLGSIWRLLEG